MNAFDVVRRSLAVVGVGGLAYALFSLFRRRPLDEDAPIRVKGGSVTVLGESEWTADDDDNEFRPRNRPSCWQIRITKAGVEQTTLPINCRRVEIDMAVDETVSTIVFKAKGSVRILDTNVLRRAANKNNLEHKNRDAYIKEVRIYPQNRNFPFTPAESKTVVVYLQPAK